MQQKSTYAAAVAFLSGAGPDHRGLRLRVILDRPDTSMEDDHAYIQWLFPLDTASEANKEAPVLTRAELRDLGDNALVTRVDGDAIAFEPGPAFSKRAEDWALMPTHNDLRISRMLRSLALQGHHGAARAFLDALIGIVGQNRHRQRALEFWRAAESAGAA